MVFLQFTLTNPSLLIGANLVRQPNIIEVPLYGKYKTKILSVQYHNSPAVNTIIRLESRQLMSIFPGSDQPNLNFSNRYLNFMVGNFNVNQLVTATGLPEFITDWDGVFEIMVIDFLTNEPIADTGGFYMVITLDVTPLDSESNVKNNTLNQHMFVSMPVRTFSK
jgi:hypothetical protein